MRVNRWIRIRLRLLAIYQELGYVPWHQSRKTGHRQQNGVYIGATENIPFQNETGRRTFDHLLVRPGYLMRDYVLRGQYNRYMAPFTSLIVFYTLFTLMLAIINPDLVRGASNDHLIDGVNGASIEVEDDPESDHVLSGTVQGTILLLQKAFELTRLDLLPDKADTSWKKSLAAFEGDLRSKGIPMFLGNFIFLWLSMAILLRKYKISFTGAAATSAFVLCQFCAFMFLALLLTWGKHPSLSIPVMGILLLVDYHQMLGLSFRAALRLTIKTGFLILLLRVLFYLLIGSAAVLISYLQLT